MRFPKSPQPWLQPGIFVGCLVPLPVTAWRIYTGTLGADVVAIVLNQLGFIALMLLSATLLCTPVKIATGWSGAVRLRRTLGLFAALYALLHFLTYFVVDQGVDLATVIEDITKRKFILVGFVALVIMIPLAVTSTNAMVRRLGFTRWKWLHRLTYVAGCLGVIHFVWRVKADYSQPIAFAVLLAAGFGFRIAESLRSRGKRTRPSPA